MQTRAKADNAVATAWRPGGDRFDRFCLLCHRHLQRDPPPRPDAPQFHMLFGTLGKMLLALHVFAVSMIATRPDNARRSRQLTGFFQYDQRHRNFDRLGGLPMGVKTLTPGFQALTDSAAILDLSDRGRIRVTGEDRARLLHAMTTNHVQSLQPGEGQYTFFLNAQGQIQADAYILCFADHFLLDVEPRTRHTHYQHLDHFIIADDATHEDDTDETFSFGLEGPQALQIAAEACDVRTARGVRAYGIRSRGRSRPFRSRAGMESVSTGQRFAKMTRWKF